MSITKKTSILFLCVANSARSQMAEGLAQRLHWPMPDPAFAKVSAEDVLDSFRDIRDRIKRSIDDFIKGKT